MIRRMRIPMFLKEGKQNPSKQDGNLRTSRGMEPENQGGERAVYFQETALKPSTRKRLDSLPTRQMIIHFPQAGNRAQSQ